MMEYWKSYNGYLVSSYGRVKNRKGEILKLFPNSVGYLRVHLGKKMYLVHRLVAVCFVPNDDPVHKVEVDHIDANKQNNRKENLQWLTPSDNTKKAFRQRKRKRRFCPVLIFKNGEFVAEAISCYKAAQYLSAYGFNTKDSQFIFMTANGEFSKYKKFNFFFAKTLFDL